jgi:hypothetical protein
MFEKRVVQLIGLCLRLWLSPRALMALGVALTVCCSLLCLQGCDPTGVGSDTAAEEEPAQLFRRDVLERWGGGRRGLTRYVDYEGGVVCYSQAKGLSCVPLSQTRLDETKVVEDATD